MVGSSERELGREACLGGTPPSPAPPHSRPQSSTCFPRPRPRTRTRSAWSSTWTRPWCTAPSRWALPSSPQPAVSEGGAYPGQGGRSLLDLAPLGLPPLPAPAILLSSQPVNNADFIIPVEIDGVVHQVRGRGRWGRGGGVCTLHPRYLPPILREPQMEPQIDGECPRLKEGVKPKAVWYPGDRSSQTRRPAELWSPLPPTLHCPGPSSSNSG